MKRLSYIDSLKGLAIILVVVGHVATGYLRGGDQNALYAGLYNAIYAFHMPLFFMISGFLFSHAYSAKSASLRAEKLKRQIFNLVFLYLLYSLFMWASTVVLHRYVNTPCTVRDLLLLPVKPIKIFWYLYVLILYYLVFSCGFIARQKTAWLLLPALIFNVISFRVPNSLPFSAKNFLFYLLFFVLGMVLNEKPQLLEKKALIFTPLPLITALFVLFWHDSRTLQSIPFVNTALGLSCSLCLFGLFCQCRPLGESLALSFVGRYSLEIYVLHLHFGTFCRALFRRTSLTDPLLLTLIASVISVLVPIAVTLLCKKLGIYRYLFAPFKGRCAGKNAAA